MALLGAAIVAAGIADALRVSKLRDRYGRTGAAAWIWRSPDTGKLPVPARVWASRGFDLAAEARSGRIKAFVDGSYRLLLDGVEVGRGGKRAGDALDVWPVPAPLAAGRHRIAVEAEHAEGTGAILIAVDLAGVGDNVIVSDGSWQVDGRPAFVWGRPPIYPWRFPALPSAESASRAAAQQGLAPS